MRLRLGIAALGCAVSIQILLSSAGAAPSEPQQLARDPQVAIDEQGRVVLDADGTRHNYPRGAESQSAPRARPLAQPMALRAATSASAVRALPENPAAASYAAFGPCVGCRSLLVYKNNVRTEIIAVAPDYTSYNPQGYWYAVTFDKSKGDYDQVFVSERIGGGIAQLLLLPSQPGVAERIAVCGIDGSIRFYSARSKQVLKAQNLQFPISQVFRCAIADFNNDGVAEYLLANSSEAAIFDARGNRRWTLPASSGTYRDIAVGQMDKDKQLEIAVAQTDWAQRVSTLAVYGAASHQIKMNLTSGADFTAATQLAVGDIDGSGVDSLIASEGWYAIDAYNVRTGTRLWRAPTSIDITSIAVASVLGGKARQVLIGDGQWGKVNVVSGATGEPLFAIANPEHSVMNMVTADLTGDGIAEIVWGAGATSSGSKRLFVADGTTHAIVGSSQHLDAPFTAASIGVTARDHRPQVIFASRTTESAYEPGAIVVLDAATAKVRALQHNFSFNAWGMNLALRLGKVDVNGGDEIVVSGTTLYDGKVETYTTTAANQIVLKSTTWGGYANSNAYPAFTALELADVDSDGRLDALVSFNEDKATRGPPGPTLAVLNPDTGSEQFRMTLPSDFWAPYLGPPAADIQYASAAKDGSLYFLVRRTAPYYSVDVPQPGEVDIVRLYRGQGTVVGSYRGEVRSAEVLAAKNTDIRIAVGDRLGHITILQLNALGLVATQGYDVGADAIDAIHADPASGTWIVASGRLKHLSNAWVPDWQSTDNGYAQNASIVVERLAPGHYRVWVSGGPRVDGYYVSR